MATHRAHTVKQGECISSIAHKYGMFPDTIWEDPENSQLKDKRKDPNVLMPGDVVYVREKEVKEESCATGQRHRFRRKGVPAKMRVQMQLDGKPLSNVSFRLYVDGVLVKTGRTGADGVIEESIPPNAKEGEILLKDDEGNEESYPFSLGTVDPIDTEEGIKTRLRSLGYNADDLAAAISEFQQKEGFTVSGSIDDATRNRIKEMFGQ
jgi:N-acetylmuramoyl-L-alanine amidase